MHTDELKLPSTSNIALSYPSAILSRSSPTLTIASALVYIIFFPERALIDKPSSFFAYFSGLGETVLPSDTVNTDVPSIAAFFPLQNTRKNATLHNLGSGTGWDETETHCNVCCSRSIQPKRNSQLL